MWSYESTRAPVSLTSSSGNDADVFSGITTQSTASSRSDGLGTTWATGSTVQTSRNQASGSTTLVHYGSWTQGTTLGIVTGGSRTMRTQIVSIAGFGSTNTAQGTATDELYTEFGNTFSNVGDALAGRTTGSATSESLSSGFTVGFTGATSSTQDSASGPSSNILTEDVTSPSYNGTSTSTTSTRSQKVSTTTVTAITYPVSTVGGTTSSSQTNSETWSTNATITYTSTILSSTSDSARLMHDTVVEAETTDWIWSVSTSGTDLPSSVASSFTKTTFTPPYIISAVSLATSTISMTNGVAATGSASSTSFRTTTITSTLGTSSSSTYSTAAPTTTGGFVPLGSSGSATTTITTTANKTLTYHTTTTRSSQTDIRSFAATFTNTFSTTSAGVGTVTSSTTQTFYASASSVLFLTNKFTSSSTQFISITGTSTLTTGAVGASGSTASSSTISSVVVSLRFSSNKSFNAQRPAYSELVVGAGFQSPVDFGYGKSYGPDPGAGSYYVSKWANGFPGLAVPMLDGNTAAATIGGTAMTTQFVASDSAIFTSQTTTNLTTSMTTVTGSFTIGITVTSPSTNRRLNTQTKNTIGGYGFYTNTDSFTTLTEVTTNSAEFGAHRITRLDSTLGTSTLYQKWAGSNSTMSIKRSEAIAYENAPEVYTVSSFTGNQFVTFSAFPST